MKNIAIILARGGSKRLPRKNILPLGGIPMVAWSIKAAIDSRKFCRVILSTEDKEIAEIGIKYGAEVPFFRKKHFDDFSSSSSATIASLKQAEQYWNEDYDFVAQLMANCPLRTHQDISVAYESFINSKAPSQISCFKFGWMNPWWAAHLDKKGVPTWIFPERLNSRSQDLSDLYCPSGAFWIASKKELQRNNSFYMPNHIMYELSWISALDIDDQSDFEMAQACFNLKRNHNILNS